MSAAEADAARKYACEGCGRHGSGTVARIPAGWHSFREIIYCNPCKTNPPAQLRAKRAALERRLRRKWRQ